MAHPTTASHVNTRADDVLFAIEAAQGKIWRACAHVDDKHPTQPHSYFALPHAARRAFDGAWEAENALTRAAHAVLANKPAEALEPLAFAMRALEA